MPKEPKRKSIPHPPPEDIGPGPYLPPPEDAPWQDQQIWEANQALRMALALEMARLMALENDQDWYQLDEKSRGDFSQLRQALDILLDWPAHISLPLGPAIQFLAEVHNHLWAEFIPPLKPDPLPTGKHAAWNKARQWMVWLYHKRNPEKDITDRQLALAMNRNVETIKKYKRRYLQELEELDASRQRLLEQLTLKV